MDTVLKRLNIADEGVKAAENLVDSLNTLKNLSTEYISSGLTFLDGDFVAPSPAPGVDANLANRLQHLDAYTIGALLSIVTPSIDTAVVDAANGNLNRNILAKVRR